MPHLRHMAAEDLPSVVEIHNKAFKGFFLQKMGVPFLSAYYRIVLSYQKSIAYVYASENGLIEGFVVGFISPSDFYQKLKGSKSLLILPTFLGLARRPWLLRQIFGSTTRVSEMSSKSADLLMSCETAELSSIAVKHSGNGIGTKLLNAFMSRAWEHGVKSITLTTDYKDNELAHSFYLKNGFHEVGIEVRNNRTLVIYLKTITHNNNLGDRNGLGNSII